MSEQQQVIEPEVLDSEGSPTPQRKPPALGGLGPILAGVFLDFLDLATFGSYGLTFGMLFGAMAGLYLAYSARMPKTLWMPVAFVAGVYCALPRTGVFPIATVMTVVNFYTTKDGGKRK